MHRAHSRRRVPAFQSAGSSVVPGRRPASTTGSYSLQSEMDASRSDTFKFGPFTKISVQLNVCRVRKRLPWAADSRLTLQGQLPARFSHRNSEITQFIHGHPAK